MCIYGMPHGEMVVYAECAGERGYPWYKQRILSTSALSEVIAPQGAIKRA